MRLPILVAMLLIGVIPAMLHAQGPKKASIYDFKLTTIDGQKVELSKYKGKVVLIVNVASECGYTDQYKGLQALHAKHAKDGLAILGFPCNDFGAQEPGDEASIKKFTKKNYGVEFDLFSKVGIDKASTPLYKFLTEKETNPDHAGKVKWNFEKFIIGRDGRIIARFAADVEPDAADLLEQLRKALAMK